MFMQSNGGLAEAGQFRGKDAILSGPGGRHRRHGPHVAAGRLRPRHRLRHGRHLHRRLALRGRVRARLHHADRRSPAARPHARHPHRRGGRRLGPPLRRLPLPRRARTRRAPTRARVLPGRRPARRHRRQRRARPHPTRPLSPGVRPGRRPAPRRRPRPRPLRRPRATRSAQRPATTARPSRSPRATCRSPSPTSPTPSSGSPSRRATTSPATPSPPSAARAASTPAWSPTRSASAPSSYRPWPVCSPRSASASPTPPPCANSPWRRRLEPRRDAAPSSRPPTTWRAPPAPNSSPRTSPRSRIRVTRRAQLRYDGTDTPLTVELTEPDTMSARLRRTSSRHVLLHPGPPDRRRSPLRRSHRHHRTPRSLRPRPLRGRTAGRPAAPPVRLHTGGAWRDVPLHRREHLPPGETVTGPAIIAEAGSTTVVDDGWRAATTDDGHLVMERVGDYAEFRPRHRSRPGSPRGLQQPLHVHRRTDGRPPGVHRPVRQHQGAARLLLRALRPRRTTSSPTPRTSPSTWDRWAPASRRSSHAAAPRMRPGDTYAVNDPYHGGTHLPDVTVITPVFDRPGEHGTARERILFYVASRGHHAEIGGIAPGSMPADSRTIDEEGILFDNWLLAEERPLPRGGDPRPAHRRARTPPATRTPTSPTCAPRSPPTRRASTKSPA